MKNINKIFAIAIVALGFSTSAFAQSSDFATSAATLVTPISILKTSDLNFATVAGSATDGTIEINASAALTATGGASVITGTPTTAVFRVTGSSTEQFGVSYPATVTLTKSGGGTLTVSGITANCPATTNLVGGIKDISFSAVLEIPANSVAGLYENANTFIVQVNYN